MGYSQDRKTGSLARKQKKNNGVQLHKRAELNGRVYIHDEARLFIAPIKNISEGGIFINGLTQIPPGSDVRVVVKSADLSTPVQATAAIIRIENSNRVGSAIQFKCISNQSKNVIHDGVFHKLNDGMTKVKNVI